MKNRVVTICTLTLFALSLARAQTDSDHPLTELIAGRIRARLSLCGSLIGMGSTASIVGESVVWDRSDASSISWNPAALGFLQNRSVITDWVPGIVQDVSKFYDIDGHIEEAMDDIVEDYGTDQCFVEYPAVSTNAGLHSSLAGFGVALPFRMGGHRFGFGFGYSTPLLLSFELTGTGIEAGIDSEEEIQGELKRIRMRTRLNINGHLQVRMNAFLIGGGVDLGKEMAFGFSFSRLRMRARCNAFARVDGIIEMSGSEYAFNDPYDPRIDFDAGEQNNLNQSFYADLSGSGWGFKVGMIKRISGRFRIGMTISLPPKIEITGMDSTINNKVPFIKIGEESASGDVEDLIDPTEIDLAKLTLTERAVDKNIHSTAIQLPKAYSFGLMYSVKIFNLVFRYTKYSGSFSSDLWKNEIRGLRFKQGMGLGIDFKYFFLGASASLIDEIKPSEKIEDEGEPMENILLPKVNLGFRIPTFDGLWIDGLIGVEPTPLLRFTFRYNF
jgi:hypothetical protein